MRWLEINESAFKHIMPLSEMAKTIIANLQYSVKVGEPNELRSPFTATFVASIAEKYGEKYGQLCEYINKYVPIIFYNGQSPGGLKGAYNHSPKVGDTSRDTIEIFLLPSLEYTPSQSPRVIQASKKIETTMLHELRHVLQRQSFAEFFHRYELAKTEFDNTTNNYKGYDYRKDPIEIDAAFLHHLYSETADNLQGFVDGVMSRFSNYKDLTPRQTEHYRRKAAKYYHDMKVGADRPATTPVQRLDAKRKQRWEGIKERILAVDTSPLTNLTNIGNPLEGRFFFPEPAFRASVAKWLETSEPHNDGGYWQVLFLAFMKKLDLTLPVHEVLETKGIDLNDAIEWAKNTDFKGFSQPFFIKCLEDLNTTS